ncbi:7b9502ec-5073-4855-a68f-1887051eb90e [Thermothielavioides terrestris]|uniref:7b9502ec-5073-4855-a68f-1887051eb90e n=1 Tax=Thermothielavioides terrestris TaxID=2587410 RepID=A0A3S4BP14_9PEZI|nr:7b9502ec-5073-4855-a68f-1887051eb90e [Thermothielavioides terrestris]
MPAATARPPRRTRRSTRAPGKRTWPSGGATSRRERAPLDAFFDLIHAYHAALAAAEAVLPPADQLARMSFVRAGAEGLAVQSAEAIGGGPGVKRKVTS